ncbi:MAG TPA: RNA methyltransferase [Patescibacteria group bacterium]|jgi:tRNA (guanosine-2'-O-)-methyltransferase|nr:RNA methyltransferase [Patescibacteria group bacterium]
MENGPYLLPQSSLLKDKMQQTIKQWYEQISTHKKELMQHALAQRTKYVTIVLEDVFQPFNASAIVRTAEIFGLQDVHVTELRNNFRPSVSISRGATKWLDVYQHQSTSVCIKNLKEKGYLIAASCLNEESIKLETVPIDQKIALLFGNELVGLASSTIEEADIAFHIPMFGFTKSFNVSVSVALCLQHLMQKIRQSTFLWQLTEDEKILIEYTWCRQLTQRKR